MRVLFVQEQSFLATALRLKLLKGFDLVVTSDSISPSKAIDHYNPNIIIADITRGRGYNYVEEAKKKNLPVIVISNNTDEHELNKAFEMGADDYISMPLSFTELALRVHILTHKNAVA